MSTTERSSSSESVRRLAPRGLRVWHLWLLALFVAVAIVNIQDQRHHEPALIALAAAGFALYGLIGWVGWRLARGLERRLGRAPLLAAYLTAMAGLFMVATVVYLICEQVYLNGHL